MNSFLYNLQNLNITKAEINTNTDKNVFEHEENKMVNLIILEIRY